DLPVSPAGHLRGRQSGQEFQTDVRGGRAARRHQRHRLVVFGSQILEEYWRLDPVEATHAGVRQFDGMLPDFSPDGLEERRGWGGFFFWPAWGTTTPGDEID